MVTQSLLHFPSAQMELKSENVNINVFYVMQKWLLLLFHIVSHSKVVMLSAWELVNSSLKPYMFVTGQLGMIL